MLTKEMKDSGVEWIGEIPKEWETRKLKIALERVKEIVDKYNGEDILSLTKGGVIVRDLVNPKGKMPTTFDGYQSISKGNIVTCLFDIDVTPRCVGIANSNGLTSPAYTQYKVINNFEKDFIYYYLLMLDNDKVLVPITKSLRNTIKSEDFLNLDFSFPDNISQKKISSHITTSISKINQLIDETQQSIEELKKYKQSLITETVTKGVDKNVEMKDSGVKWIGEIPINWSLTKFGRISSINANLVNPDDFLDFQQVSPDDIEKDSGKLIKFKSVRESGVISNNYSFSKGQILYSKIRPKLNKVVIAPFDGLCSADMYPIDTNENSEFILFLMMSYYFLHQVSFVTADRVKMPKINQNELANLLIVLPNKSEQEEIVKFLKDKIGKIDSVINQKFKITSELEQYKKSLVYEYVTGKKEV